MPVKAKKATAKRGGTRQATPSPPEKAPDRIAAVLRNAAGRGELSQLDLERALERLGMRRTESRGARDRRQDILQAAIEVFSARGYSAATLQDIADQLGLTRQSFYYYFKSKQELLEAIALMTADATDVVIDDALARSTAGGGAGAFEQVLYRYALHIAGQKTTAVMMRHYDEMSVAVQVELAERRRRREGLVLDLLRRGIRAGELHSREPRLALKCAFETIHAMYHWYREDGPLPREEVVQAMIHQLVHGFASG